VGKFEFLNYMGVFFL